MGTPQFAVPSLEALIEAGHEVLAVYTQPDRPKGRGGQVAMSPVKLCAQAHQVPVLQPERVRRPESQAHLQSLAADIMVVVGYGQLIPQSIIDMPRLGIVNVHASLLPKYRGAAPIQWAVANGETITGVTTMRIDAGLDTGEMLLKQATAIGEEENSLELGSRLSQIGAQILVKTLADLEAGNLQPEPQNHAEATFAPILKKEDGAIDWTLSAEVIHNRGRGLLPWPGIYSTFRGHLFHIWKTKKAYDRSSGSPGTIHAEDRRLFVGCGQGTTLELVEVQLEGRKRISADAFLNGQRLTSEETLGERTN